MPQSDHFRHPRRETLVLLHLLWIIALGLCALFATGGYARCPQLDSFKVDGCGQSSLASCMKHHPNCLLASHLDGFASWIDTLKKTDPCSTRVADLAARCSALNDSVTTPIDLSHVDFAGEKQSPFSIVLYISTSCPLCKRVYKALYYDVTSGALHGKAKLGIKVFSSYGWDLALCASQRFGKQCELLLALAAVEERITKETVVQKAAEIGIPVREFRAAMRDSSLIAEVKSSAAEAHRNDVKVTPTIFINGVRYRSYKDPQWIADAVLYRFQKRLRPAGN